ncbi:MAG: outer membrane receptor for ferrienterochelin and colicins [Flavobacteriales bacterium]|jgi:outer membrane receptor for ferrienterochelin and colicins
MNKSIFHVFGVMSIFLSSSVWSDNPNLLALSLEDLLSVSIVSRLPETIVTSPAVVSSLNASEMATLGLHSLQDIIQFLPGIETNESIAGTPTVQVRGFNDSFNQKILLMIDGSPYWMPASGEIPMFGLPISSIAKVEVIRGPGSETYGSNALVGVINVITKQGAGNTVSASAGDGNYRNVGGRFAKDLFGSTSANLSFEHSQYDGFSAQVENGFLPFDADCSCFPEEASGIITKGHESSSFLISAKNDNLKAKLHWFSSNIYGSADSSIFSPQVTTQYGSLMTLDYDETIGESAVKIFVERNQFYSDIHIKNINELLGLDGDGEIYFDHNGRDNVRWRSGAHISTAWSGNLRSVIGVDHESRSSGDQKYTRFDSNEPLEDFGLVLQEDGEILLINGDSSKELGLYSELDYHYRDWRLIVGGRHTKSDLYGSKFTPRVNVVVSLTENQSIKALYSEGYSSPTFRQTAGVQTNGTEFDNNVIAETIRSTDLAWTWTKAPWHVVVNAYEQELNNGIEVVQGRFTNIDKVSRRGLEADIQWRYKHWLALLAISHVQGGGNNSDPTRVNVSDELIKLGLSKQWKSHSFGSSLRYASERSVVSDYALWNINYEYSFKNWQLFSTIENLSNSKILYPNLRSQTRSNVQGVDGRNIRLGIRLNY